MTKNLLSIAIIILSLSIGYLAFVLATDMTAVEQNEDSSIATSNFEKGLLTADETAAYLSLSIDELDSLIRRQDSERIQLGSFSTYQFIPYITINNQRYFNKEEVNEWIKFNTLIWQQIE